MGAGIAGQLAKKYPYVAIKDYAYSLKGIKKLGNIDEVIIEEQNKTGLVINAYTQYNPGRDVSYAAIEICLRKINDKFKGKRIALPRIGAGIAGGDWNTIRKMIITFLPNVNVTIIYWPGDKKEIEKYDFINKIK